MKKVRQMILSLLLLVIVVTASAQVPIQDTLQVCYNTGFELGMTSEYSFTAGSSENVAIDCDFDVSGFSPETVGGPSGNVTLITSPNDDPVLAGLSTPISLPQVHSGSYSIKLNNDDADFSVTTMSKAFHAVNEVPGDTFVRFRYSAIMQTHTLVDDDNLTRFIIRIYDSAGNILAQDCIDPVNDAVIFTNAGNTTGSPIYYTGWRCHALEYDPTTMIENPGRIEFTIIDCGKGEDYSTVYIDEICNKDICSDDTGSECPDCPILHGDVPSGTDEVEALNCIKAYNTISSGATALYYAGYDDDDDDDPDDVIGEILLLPGTDPLEPTDTLGFECLLGSTGHFYIQECPGPFTARHAMTQTEEPKIKPTGSLQIFPNPTNSELNVLSDAAVRSLRLVALDGKLVMQQQPGTENNRNMKLDVHSLSSGIYILTVETNEGTITTHKIVRE